MHATDARMGPGDHPADEQGLDDQLCYFNIHDEPH
jgi:hypothetical protein